MQIVVATSTLVVRRRLLEQVGGFDVRQRMFEDYDLWLRLSQLSEIDGVQQTLLHKRRHQEHFGNEFMAFADRLRALEKMLAGVTDRSLLLVLRAERAKVTAALARSRAKAVVRAVTTAGMRRFARSVLRWN